MVCMEWSYWRSDGTWIGTYMISDIAPGPTTHSVTTAEFAGVDSILYFTANVGTQLWRTNGTASGTYSLMSLILLVDSMDLMENYIFLPILIIQAKNYGEAMAP